MSAFPSEGTVMKFTPYDLESHKFMSQVKTIYIQWTSYDNYLNENLVWYVWGKNWKIQIILTISFIWLMKIISKSIR